MLGRQCSEWKRNIHYQKKKWLLSHCFALPCPGPVSKVGSLLLLLLLWRGGKIRNQVSSSNIYIYIYIYIFYILIPNEGLWIILLGLEKEQGRFNEGTEGVPKEYRGSTEGALWGSARAQQVRA